MTKLKQRTDKLPLTENRIREIPKPFDGQLLVLADTKQPGLILRIWPTDKRVWYLRKKVAGKVQTIKLGSWPAMSYNNAVKEAQQKIVDLDKGIDVNAEKRKARARKLSFQDALDDYLKHRKLKPVTRKTYRRNTENWLNDWLGQPLASITVDDVRRRHRKITREGGPYAANVTLKIVGAVWRWASAVRDLETPNPVQALAAAKEWNREDRRVRHIPLGRLAAWWTAAEQEPEHYRDYLRFMLLTGMRRREAARIRWDDVDLQERRLRVRDTKSGRDLWLPITKYLLKMLERRRAASQSQFVFPSPRKDHDKPVSETQYSCKRVAERCDVKFSAHDLRRTFITMAESLDLPYLAVKRLVNHSPGADVTAGYAVWDVERLRKPAQAIEDKILSAARTKTSLVNIENAGSD